jgi:hypothetical protein
VLPKSSFATRNTDDIIICDFCHCHKCDWLHFTPAKYPGRCPGEREIRIADEPIPRDEFLRRTKLAKKVGVYLLDRRKWFVSAEKAKSLPADELRAVMKDVRSWSGRNTFRLISLVTYEKSERVPSQKRLL